ncbi:MAG: hypothetical protein WDN49_18695 [Acetobacteraceae bacterium]
MLEQQDAGTAVAVEPARRNASAGCCARCRRRLRRTARIVADKTGYPEDVLLPRTWIWRPISASTRVKRMEILAAASERLGIPRERGGAQTRAAGTLTGMAGLLHSALVGDAAPTPAAPAARPEPEARAPTRSPPESPRRPWWTSRLAARAPRGCPAGSSWSCMTAARAPTPSSRP